MSRPAHSRLIALWLALITTGLISPAAAQQASSSSNSPTHLRALAVYEYLGSYNKPSRSRLVPVAIWDGSQFQPASLYLADPTPLSVQSGTLYELMKDGSGVGQVEVLHAEQIARGRFASDWIGLGKFLPNPPPGPGFKIPANLTAKAKFSSDMPHFAYKPPAATGVAGGMAASSSGGPTNDGANAEPGRPTLEQRPRISGPSTSSTTTPAEEGRPTLHQPAIASQSGPPILHHRSAAQELNSRQATPSGRPILRYDTHTVSPVTQLKQDALTGMPPEMHQIAAISDSDGTTGHSYAWDWPTPGDKTAALRKLEALALQYLTPPNPPAPPKTTPKRSPTPARTPAAPRNLHAHDGKPAQPVPAPPLTLTHEHFRAFQLDYGSGPVYVFSARTSAPYGSTTYITLIAQPDFAGGLIPLFKTITRSNLLEYQPRMRLIDAVDATGTGRADLLFDLIYRRDRHFALFSIQNGQANEIFHTGPQ